jgi:hypothetical protein
MRKHYKSISVVLREDVVNSKMFGDVKYRLCKYKYNLFVVIIFVYNVEFPISIFQYQDIAMSYYNSILLVGGYNDELLKKSLNIHIRGSIDAGVGESISGFVIASKKGIEMDGHKDKNE